MLNRLVPPRHAQAGLSLVELMISIALGLFLTWGAMQAFLTGKQLYNTQQALSRLQENGRMVHEFLSFDIRNAGNYGCGSSALLEGDVNDTSCSTGVNMLEDATTIELDFGSAVYGVDGADGSPTLGENFHGPGLDPAPKEGSDVLVSRGITGSGVQLASESKVGDANFEVTVTSDDGNGCYSGMCPGDILVLTDCVKTKIFQATKIQGGTMILHDKSGINRCAAWGGSGINQPTFSEGAQVMKVQSTFYYIANNAAGRPSLYMRPFNGESVELIEGVEDMQLEYGIGEDKGDGKGYLIREFKPADKVEPKEWDGMDESGYPRRAVVAVRYSLLVRGEEDVLDTPQVYAFNGKDYVGGVEGTEVVAGSDRRLRQVFTGTVGMRSRIK